MLDIKRIRENPDELRSGLSARNADTAVVDLVLELDKQRRSLLTQVEALKGERNSSSKQIGAMKKDGKDTSEIQASMKKVGEDIAAMDEDVRGVSEQLHEAVLGIPNIPHSTTPVGADESANVELRTWGEPKKFDFKPLTHIEIGERLGILDLPRATRMSGSGFPLFVGKGAMLQRALIKFMIDIHIKEQGYTEIWPPVLCNTDAMTGTGQLPKMAEDMYKLEGESLYLIPTAEVPVTNYYHQEIIDKPLPVYLTAYSMCFRKEAGAAGKDTRGIIRVHQFDKVEMVKFVEPHTSYDELESLVGNAEDVLQRLGLCYRVLQLCSGDISFAAAKCYDLELWAPGQDDWLEVSSCSCFEDFQARRAGIRYRDADGKVQFVHTLNGSGVALPRIVVAILENCQQADGTVKIPEALVSYMDGLEVIEPSE